MESEFRLRVKANPGSSHRNMVWRGDHLKVNLTSPPEDGKANDELVEYLATTFGIKENQIELVRGESSERKQLMLYGVDRGNVVRTLQSRKD